MATDSYRKNTTGAVGIHAEGPVHPSLPFPGLSNPVMQPPKPALANSNTRSGQTTRELSRLGLYVLDFPACAGQRRYPIAKELIRGRDDALLSGAGEHVARRASALNVAGEIQFTANEAASPVARVHAH